MSREKKEEHTSSISVSILSDNILDLLKINLIIPFGGFVENLNKDEKILTQIKKAKMEFDEKQKYYLDLFSPDSEGNIQYLNNDINKAEEELNEKKEKFCEIVNEYCNFIETQPIIHYPFLMISHNLHYVHNVYLYQTCSCFLLRV